MYSDPITIKFDFFKSGLLDCFMLVDNIKIVKFNLSCAHFATLPLPHEMLHYCLTSLLFYPTLSKLSINFVWIYFSHHFLKVKFGFAFWCKDAVFILFRVLAWINSPYKLGLWNDFAIFGMIDGERVEVNTKYQGGAIICQMPKVY